jgi:outer membrane protein
MKKIVIIVCVIAGFVAAGNQVKAQSKIGYISLQELLPTMPEYKKADTSMVDYQNALSQNYDAMRSEWTQQDSLLNSKDTARYTKAQLEIKRRNFNELYIKLNGWQNQAQQMLQAKQQELIAPIQKKAVDAVQSVAKENGYTYVFTKEALLVSPPAEDILPLVKKKLGLK